MWDRLSDSFDLLFGPARYLELMSPMVSDGETLWSRLGTTQSGLADGAGRVAQGACGYDAGHPSPLGLLTVKSTDPRQLKRDHQVLACGYDLEDTTFRLRLCDPNQPERDDMVLSVGVGDLSRKALVDVWPMAAPVYAFFRVSYAAVPPP